MKTVMFINVDAIDQLIDRIRQREIDVHQAARELEAYLSKPERLPLRNGRTTPASQRLRRRLVRKP